MKALVMKKPGELVLEDRDKPVPKEGETLLKVLRVGVCGTDLHAYEGRQPFFKYPRITGHELAAQVAGTRDIVTVLPYLRCGCCIACRQGKTNCCTSLKCLGVHVDGGLQEYISVPDWYIVPAPGLALDDIAAIECFSIGFHAVRRASPPAGVISLVVGAGPIGIGVIHALKLRGVKVIALDINAKRLDYAKNTARADHIINGAEKDPVNILAEITNGDMPLYVFDATGNSAQMAASFNFTASGGVLVFVGLTQDNISFADTLLHAKEMTVMASRNATKEDFANVIEGISKNRFSTAAFVTHKTSLAEAAHEFPRWIKSESSADARNAEGSPPETDVVKAVIEVGESE